MFHSFILRSVMLMAIASLVTGVSAAEKPAAAKFAKVQGEFEAIDKSLGEIIKKFRTATPDEQEKLRKEYEDLASKGRKLIEQLRSTAEAAYAEAPNEDKKVAEVLVSMIAADLQQDRYSSSASLAQLLIKNKCEQQGLFNLAGMAAFCLHDFDLAEEYLKKAKENDTLDRNSDTYLSQIEKTKANWKVEMELRKKEAEADDLPRVKMETSKGPIVFELFENEAPQAVGNFVQLIESKFYDGLAFHRVLPNFMAQGGCPDGNGTGGPGYNIYCECKNENYRKHFSGVLSMAHAGRNTGGSQFFITFRPTPHLDGNHTVFGRVIEGMDVLSELQRIDPSRGGEPDKIKKLEVLRKRDHKYVATKVED